MRSGERSVAGEKRDRKLSTKSGPGGRKIAFDPDVGNEVRGSARRWGGGAEEPELPYPPSAPSLIGPLASHEAEAVQTPATALTITAV